MIKFSKRKFLASVAVLVSGFAYANSMTHTTINNNQLVVPSFSAHGTMDKQSALLLKSLLQNPNIKVNAVVSQPNLRRNMNPEITYTIKGKTNRRTAKMLKQLLQNSKHLSIHAVISKSEALNSSKNQTPSFTTHFPEYTPFYYKGVPPIYNQGNMLWYPIKIEDRKISNEATALNHLHDETLASN